MNQFEREIEVSLISLPQKGRVLFAALTIERLYPHYIAFEKKYNWGDSRLLFDAIAIVYQYLMNVKSVSDDEIKTIMSRIDLITPDMDDFGSALSSFALNACTSIYSSLKYLLDKDINNITDIVSYTLDTLDLYIQDKEDFNTLDPSRDIQIEHDNFMLQEKQRMLNLIDKLSNLKLDKVTDALIESLRDKRPIINLSLLSE